MSLVEATDQTLPEAPIRKVRHIGIHGPRNAGKTCYLGCLYGSRAGDPLRICFSDGETLAYLSGVWKDLSQQQLPEATRGMPTDLYLDLEDTAHQRTSSLRLRDYPGALVQPIGNNATPLERQLSASVKQWISDAHALLIFLDASEPSVEQIDALDLLLTELRRASPNGYTLQRPIGLVLTKWDRINPLFGDPKAEEEKARTYLLENKVFKQIHEKLCDAGERLHVFPVSAFGSQGENNLPPPPESLQPYNLFAPLLWASEKADEVLFDLAREEAARMMRAARRPRQFRAACAEAVRLYEQLKRDYLIQGGPTAARIDQEIRAIRGRQRRRILAAAAIPVAFLTIAAGVTAWYGKGQDKIRITRLARFRSEHSARSDADLRVRAEEEYLRTWSSWLSPRYRREVHNWLETDGEIAHTLAVYHAVREQDRTLTPNNKFGDVIYAYREFKRHHDGTPEAVEAEARVLVLGAIMEDHHDYEQLRRVSEQGDAASFEEAYRRARDYEQSARTRKLMLEPVHHWRTWFEGLQKEGDYFIEVDSISIPKGSDLEAFWGTKPRVHIELNGVRHSTGWAKGKDATFHQRVGPFPFKWGQAGKLRVEVEGHHALLKNDRAVRTIDDPRFILGRANGHVLITCDKGKTITLNLRCAGAAPPPLPVYQVR
jgi:hypothetical protein